MNNVERKIADNGKSIGLIPAIKQDSAPNIVAQIATNI